MIPNDEKPAIEIQYTSAFKRDIKKLSKRYRNIRSDVSEFINILADGQLLGERVQHTDYIVYKARIKNSDASKGKSGGYRIIYFLKTEKNIVLLTIYSKSDYVDIPTKRLKQLIDEFDQ